MSVRIPEPATAVRLSELLGLPSMKQGRFKRRAECERSSSPLNPKYADFKCVCISANLSEDWAGFVKVSCVASEEAAGFRLSDDFVHVRSDLP